MSLYETAYRLRKAELERGETPGPHHGTAYLSRRLIKLLESFALNQSQVKKLLATAEGMARGTGRRPEAQKRRLARAYKDSGLSWKQIALRVNAETGSDHPFNYYERLAAYKPKGSK